MSARLLVAALLACAALAHAAGGTPDAVTPDGGRYYGPLVNGRFEGHGRIEWDNGSAYEGAFVHGQYEGRGRFEAPGGEIYEGDFEKGDFTGYGTISRPDGSRYKGQVRKWLPHGQGHFVAANGDIYDGEFKDGALDGQGSVIYARARPDGRTEAKGEFRNWQLVGDPEVASAGSFVEEALRNQGRLLDEALAAIKPGRPGVIDMYLLAVGGDGSQEVFRREVEFVRSQFDRRYGTAGRSIALVNSRSTVATLPMATVSNIGEALKTIANRMDRDEDILFLFLTSHGSRDHTLTLAQNYMALRELPARDLGHMLKESGIRWKVIVVSACYSGGFIDPLKDDSTLIITAARHDRTSFGCADENDFTYFGRAYFKEALPVSHSFQDAFTRADALVALWEKKDQPKGLRSLPQIHTTPAITQQLQRWWAEQTK